MFKEFRKRPNTVDEGVYNNIVHNNSYRLPDDMKGMTCIDIGTHIGSFTKACIDRGADKVYAYEANIDNYMLARENLSQWGDKVELYFAAVTRSDVKIASLNFNPCPRERNTGGGHVRRGEGQPVVAIALDDILLNIDVCNVLKLDCEGSEFPILYTSKHLDKVLNIAGEYHGFRREEICDVLWVDGKEYSIDNLAPFLQDHNFHVQHRGKERVGLFFCEKDKGFFHTSAKVKDSTTYLTRKGLLYRDRRTSSNTSNIVDPIQTLNIQNVNISAPEDTYRQHHHVPIDTILDGYYQELNDIYTKNICTNQDIDTIRIRIRDWYEALADGGTLFFVQESKYTDITAKNIEDELKKEGFKIRSVTPRKDDYHIKARKPPAAKDIANLKQKKGFIWTSPYGGSWTQKCLEDAGHPVLMHRKIKTIKELEQVVKGNDIDLLVMGNFIQDRHAIKAKALQLGIDVVHGEDGFIPHYQTLHADPVGFCWESSLPLIKFTGTVRDKWRDMYNTLIQDRTFTGTVSPYKTSGKNVLFPMQLLSDRVNIYGQHIKGSWIHTLQAVRDMLPSEVNLYVKTHPRANTGNAEEKAWIKEVKNTYLFQGDINIAMSHCDGLIGMNSTVLTEARLLYNKPVWCLADSWYTNHHDLFFREDAHSKSLSNVSYLDTGIPKDEYMQEYVIWYLGQLLARQHKRPSNVSEKDAYIKWLMKRTYKSYLEYGQDIFDLDGIPW